MNFLSSYDGLYPDLQAIHLYPLSTKDYPVLSYPFFKRSVSTTIMLQSVGMLRVGSGVAHIDSVAVLPRYGGDCVKSYVDRPPEGEETVESVLEIPEDIPAITIYVVSVH